MTKKQALDRLCQELNLSEVAIGAVSETVQRLAEFERDKPRYMSGLKRHGQLVKLHHQASVLQATLKELDPRNDWSLSINLFRLGFPGSLNTDADARLRHPGWCSGMIEVLDQLMKAASKSTIDVAPQTLREGRVSTLMFYAVHVSNLANVVCTQTQELSFGRNGDFERLCDGIFEAAGIHSKCEGAIKFVIKQRKAGVPLLWGLH